jgi:hypothetical protein
MDYHDAYTMRNSLGNLVSGQLYMFHRAGVRDGWESRRFPSALMAVNVEARQIAREFYYIQIPASDRSKYSEGKPTIYLNPEWDYIRFFTKVPTDALDFLYDIRMYDPRGNGVRHWVVSPHSLKQLTKRNFEKIRCS